MAVFSLGMAAKMLVKQLAKKMTKKAIVKSVKKGIKKKVKSKIKDKFLGKKKDKRQVAKNIMQEQGEWSGGGAIVATAQPTTALIPSGGDKGGALATIDKEGGDKGPVDFSKMSQKLDNIVGMTGAIAMMTKVEEKQAKDQSNARKIAKNKRDKAAREAKLESKGGGIGSSVKAGIAKKASDPLAAAIKFFVNIALGAFVLQMLKVIQRAGKIWEALKKGFLDFFWIIRAVLWKGLAFKGIGAGIKQLGKVVQGLGKLIISPFEKAAELIKTAFSKAGKAMSNWIGGIASKVKNFAQNALKGAGNMIKGAGNFIKNLPGIKQTLNLGKNIAGKVSGGFKAAKSFVGGGIKNVKSIATKGIQGAKDLAGKGLSKAKGFLGKGFKAAKGFLGFGAKAGKVAGKTGGKVGGKILKGGIGKIAKRGALKLLGKGAVKTIGKIFGRIPVIGPLMVALASMLSGDPPKQTLFKAMGAALGGLAGSFIPIPVLGTILGEIIGEFAGDLFYTLISGGGIDGVVEKFKKKATQILQGGQAAAKWLGGGIMRFIKNIMTKDPISIKEGGGRRTVATKAAKFLGMYDWLAGLGYAGGKDGQIDKFPNLLNVINPLKYAPLLVKSFFPPSEKVVMGEHKDSASANLGEKEVDVGGDTVAKDDPTQEEGEDTIVLDKDSAGGGGVSGGGRSKVLVVGSGDTLNSYYKAQVKQKLATV